MHFLLFYDLVPDYAGRRAEFRDAHLTKAWAAHNRGELLVAGALADPMDTAVLMFSTASAAVVETETKVLSFENLWFLLQDHALDSKNRLRISLAKWA